MKKLIFISIFLLGLTSHVNANTVNVGVSLTGGVFDAAGSEIFSGDHVSNASSTKVTKKSSAEGEDVETLFGYGSIFAEFTPSEIADGMLSIGLDYVPMGLDSQTTENVQKTGAYPGSDVTNKVDVSFDDMRTVYLKLQTPIGAYFKIGYTEVDVVTNEVLGTGGKYGDTTLEGTTIGIGYNHNLNDGMFVRLEGNLMDFDDVTLTNQNDSNKSIKAEDIEGYGARLSVGKSF